jgi:hypothetical protein
MILEKTYQRKHLRAPYFETVLFEDDDFVFKATTLNISEGGMLLDMLPHFPSKEDVSMLVPLTPFPYLKNFSLERLKEFSREVFPPKIVRIKVKMVRREGVTTDVADVFKSRIGVQFTELDRDCSQLIQSYVDVFSSNLIYLQVLIDSVHGDQTNLEKIRLIADILGYTSSEKLSLLRSKVSHDYKSLQWL